ncbi:MAG: hypothetical protein ABI277_09345 [Burkholderiaceae bacterium]
MRIAAALGPSSARTIHYAIVGLGDHSQEVMLPGVAHTGSSEVAAPLTDDPVKPRKVGARYGVDGTCGYDGSDALDLRVIEGIMKALETDCRRRCLRSLGRGATTSMPGSGGCR